MQRFALLIAVSLALSAQALAAEQPNIVLIMADDIGFECYGSYDSKFYKTPNIDRLAETGVRFTQAYANPLCTPSRVKIMTGRYNFRNYTTFGELDLSQPTFAKMLKEAGYATAIAGKWQLSVGDLSGPHQAGFDEYLLWHFAKGKGFVAGDEPLDPMFESKGSRYKSPRLFQNGKLVPDTEGKHSADIVTDFLCDFIEREKDGPFLVYYPMILVHNPFEPTPDSPDWDERDKSRGELEHFRDMVHYMDRAVGKLVAKLDEEGLRENTLIMVTGDNGTNKAITSPYPGRGEIKGGKGMMTDAGTRVCFVANWQGAIQSGVDCDSPINFADVLPTIAEATGAKAPEGTDGKSFLPLLKGDTSNERGWIFISYSSDGLSSAPYRCFIRDREWKLYSDGSLYHVPSDWLEEQPVEGPKADAVRERLQPIMDRILADAPNEHIDRGTRTQK